MTSAASDREIIIERVLNAPIERVWEAFTNPDHLIHWWGPTGFTNTFHEHSVEPGGVWRFIMHGPDGTDYPNKIVYEEVVKHKKLSFMHTDDMEGASIHHFHDVITFDDLGDGKTKVTMCMEFESKEKRDATIKLGAVEGGNQTLAKLEKYLETM